MNEMAVADRWLYSVFSQLGTAYNGCVPEKGTFPCIVFACLGGSDLNVPSQHIWAELSYIVKVWGTEPQDTLFDSACAAIERAQDAAALRAELASIERRVAALETKLANVPDAISKANAAERAAIVAEFNKALDGLNRQLAASEQRTQAEIRKVSQQRASGGGSSAAKAPAPRRSGNYYEHIVAPGQSLSLIAKEYGVTQSEIIAENGLKNPDSLRVGQTLYIPAP